MTIIEPSVSLEWITGNSAKRVELAMRTCYKSVPGATEESTEDFVKRIALHPDHPHESTIEHACASFRIICDRGISHEIVRHRLASYSQESTRYVNYTKEKHGGGDIKFIHPLDLTPEQLEFSVRAYTIIEGLYNEAIALGMKPQQARDYLPSGLKTELVMTTNFREWRHFLRLRTAKAAHPKMRVVARQVGGILAQHCPALFEEWAFEGLK